MMNEKLIARALRMLEDRADHWEAMSCMDNHDEGAGARASAYGSAVDILRYAIEGNVECLAQYDYRKDNEEEG